jgi:hypothetical protein
MSKGFVKRRVQQHARYTGLSYQAAWECIADLEPGQAPIPEAAGAQRLLEGRVFTYLRCDVDYFAHPLGVASVRPGRDDLTIALDASVTRHGHPLVMHAVEGLLPAEPPDSRDVEEPVIGVRGIRVAAVTRDRLVLSLAGTSARLTVTSTGRTDWRQLLDARASQLRRAGCRLCWDRPGLTAAETAYERAHAGLFGAEDAAAWLPSGLLRRIGLFHTVSAAYCAQYWTTVDTWKFVLRHQYGVAMPHDSVIAHLTDPRWGLPLVVEDRYCQCGAPWLDPRYEQQCTVELSHREQVPGGLQLRFLTNYAQRPIDHIRSDLIRAQADPAWVHRVLPIPDTQPAGPAPC